MQVVKGTKLGPGGPAGYPTLKTLSLTAQLQQAGVEVFGQGSRKESLILKVQVCCAMPLHRVVLLLMLLLLLLLCKLRTPAFAAAFLVVTAAAFAAASLRLL